MKRRVTAAFCASVSVAILMVTAPSASAAPIQDFYLTKNGGVRIAVAQGIVVSGVGTFTETSGTSETLQLAAGAVPLSQTPVSHTETLDPRTCRAAVREAGTFGFSYDAPDGSHFGGGGSYTLAGTRTGQRVGIGCVFPSPALSQYALTAQATNVFVVPPPPPPPNS